MSHLPISRYIVVISGILLFTGCGAFDFVFTGSNTKGNPIQLVFLQNKGTGFELNVGEIKNDSNNSLDLPTFNPDKQRTFPIKGTLGKAPINLDSSNQGNKIYLTFQDRVQVLSRETLNTAPLDNLIPDPTRDQEWLANPSSQIGICLFQSSQVSSDDRWISALVQCGPSNDPSASQIWVYSLEQRREWLRLINPFPFDQNIESLNKQGFPYIISENTLYFIKPNPQNSNQSNLYSLDLNAPTLNILFNYVPKTLEGIYSLGVVEKSAVALTGTGIKNIISPTSDLTAPLSALTKATRVWSSINRTAFWDAGTDSGADQRIQFKNTQNFSRSSSPFMTIKDIIFSNDDYAWVLTANSLVRFDIGILNPNSPLNYTSLDYNSEAWKFSKTPPFALAWLLSSEQASLSNTARTQP